MPTWLIWVLVAVASIVCGGALGAILPMFVALPLSFMQGIGWSFVARALIATQEGK